MGAPLIFNPSATKSASLLSVIRALHKKIQGCYTKKMATLNLHNWMPISRANGPGNRFVLWFQGCSLRCPGCFNEGTHSNAPRMLASHENVGAAIQMVSDRIEGVTISGGEPMEQPHGLLALLRDVRRRTRLSAVVYSGYTYEEITRSTMGPDILDHVDILISGRFYSHLVAPHGLVGSSNQEIRLLSARYSLSDLANWYESELIIDSRGRLILSGVQAPVLTREGFWEYAETSFGRDLGG